MIVTLEVPDEFAREYHLDNAESARLLLEAFVLERFAGGELSVGQVGEALGLSFHEAEQFLQQRGAPTGLTDQQHQRGLQNLKRLLSS